MPTNITKIYSDIDLFFNEMPVTHDVSMSFDTNAVIRSVRGLLLTHFYERPFQPDLGSNLDTLLFEPISNLTASQLQQEIINVIQNHEPRVQIDQVIVTPFEDQNSFNVTLIFFIANNTSSTQIQLLLQRSR
jgi:phage baseplate assembly protein W